MGGRLTTLKYGLLPPREGRHDSNTSPCDLIIWTTTDAEITMKQYMTHESVAVACDFYVTLRTEECLMSRIAVQLGVGCRDNVSLFARWSRTS